MKHQLTLHPSFPVSNLIGGQRLSLLSAVFFFLSGWLPTLSQTTANDHVRPYREPFQYGSNLLGNKNGWNDTGLTSLVQKAGGHTIRPTLPEYFLDQYGYNIRVNEFQYYKNNLGMKEITCFIQQPSAAHADNTIFPGCTQHSRLFANLYKPIWNADGSVNPNNYYAMYVYKLLQTYGSYVRFWEVVNEPDLTIANTNADNWLIRAPLPNESVNTQAPIYYYIRTLRITWEVVKKFKPGAYVTTGGIGASQYLDALLRYTDNPVNGATSAAYPNKGGAYFDVVSYHCYPGYYLRYWDNLLGGFKYTRNSDFAASKIIVAKNALQAVLSKYGYDGSLYPKKHFILTETNVSRRTKDWRFGSDTMQRNFGMKALIFAQRNNIKQLYFYTVGEQTNAQVQASPVYGNDEYFLMGLYENLYRDAPGAQKLTQLGVGVKSVSTFLYGYKYDSVQTQALALPANVDGGAFRKNGVYTYVLWAKNPNDASENFAANYSFPTALHIGNVFKSEWNYSVTGLAVKRSSVNIALTASPSFFKPEISSSAVKRSVEAEDETAESDPLDDVIPQSTNTGSVVSKLIPETQPVLHADLTLTATPNPVISEAVINFQSSKTGKALVSISDMQGRLLGNLFTGVVQANVVNTAHLSAAVLAPGLYIVRFTTSAGSIARKIVVAR